MIFCIIGTIGDATIHSHFIDGIERALAGGKSRWDRLDDSTNGTNDPGRQSQHPATNFAPAHGHLFIVL